MGYLPRADAEARATFEELKENLYLSKGLGRTQQDNDELGCDCWQSFRRGIDPPHLACGHDSDCINRLTQMECVEGECRCGGYCQNQRFQRREYAPIEIVQTEKKGFGLRAGADIHAEQFIYEYVGEVVPQHVFLKRMQAYFDEGIRHFYFMMLQKEEYIDATKMGGIGRFANHSCAPNCYVAKWVVGKHVRMGIFAKRDIMKGEELTFNYNVDRFGHDAQVCYCGEPNCIGFIGGKTQTDIAVMDDLYLDALGIAEDVEKYQLKGTKKKKSKNLDEDYEVKLKPIKESEVPKVIAAVRQSTSNRRILVKLLKRIKMTDDVDVQRRLMRMHGFSIQSGLLTEFADDNEICTLVLELLVDWTGNLLARNKITDSKIEEPVSAFLESEDDHLKDLAGQLITRWSTLDTAYRIPRRAITDTPTDDSHKRPPEEPSPARPPPDKRPRLANTPSELFVSAKVFSRPAIAAPPPGMFPRPSFGLHGHHHRLPHANSHPPTPTPPPPAPTPSGEASRLAIEKIIAEAAKAREAEEAERARQEAEEGRRKEEERRERKARAKRKEKDGGGSGSKERNGHGHGEKSKAKEKAAAAGAGADDDPAAKRERRLRKLIGEAVVKTMSQYKDDLAHDTFKKHAKTVTELLVAKELKKPVSVDAPIPTSLSDDKQSKIRAFTKEYTKKLVAHKKSSSSGKRSSVAAASAAGSTPSPSAAPGEGEDDDDEMDLIVDEPPDDDDHDGGSTTPPRIPPPPPQLPAEPPVDPRILAARAIAARLTPAPTPPRNGL